MSLRIQQIYHKLQEKEYRLTPQRQTILNVFMTHASEHLSADDVFNLVRRLHPDIGLATVYRTLDLLAELGVLQRIDFGDGRARYELRDPEQHHHHHLICTRCGRVEEFQADLLEPLEAMIARRSGFEVHDHQVKFFGLCRDCRI